MGCCGYWWCAGGGVSYLCDSQQQCLAGDLLPFEWQHLAVEGHSTSPVYFNSFFFFFCQGPTEAVRRRTMNQKEGK